MISAILGVAKVVGKAVIGAVKLGIGVARLGWRTARAAFKIGKGVGYGSWKIAKKGAMLGKKVRNVVNQTRTLTYGSNLSPALAHSTVFTSNSTTPKTKATPTVKPKQSSKNQKSGSSSNIKKSKIFNKNE